MNPSRTWKKQDLQQGYHGNLFLIDFFSTFFHTQPPRHISKAVAEHKTRSDHIIPSPTWDFMIARDWWKVHSSGAFGSLYVCHEEVEIKAVLVQP